MANAHFVPRVIHAEESAEFDAGSRADDFSFAAGVVRGGFQNLVGEGVCVEAGKRIDAGSSEEEVKTWTELLSL